MNDISLVEKMRWLIGHAKRSDYRQEAKILYGVFGKNRFLYKSQKQKVREMFQEDTKAPHCAGV